MNRREFLETMGGVALVSGCATMRGTDNCLPAFVKNAEELPPILTDVEIRSNPAMKGRRVVSFFIDDTIWVMRDLSRRRPKSLFDNPFLKQLKDCHDRYGLKLQLNLFYRTDFYYGMDEFTLADMTDAYRAEWQANKDWLKLGFHSLQEFPDYPWINISGADVKKLFGMIKGEIVRFAGEGVFTNHVVPHWCPMSEEGCRALKECGVRLMEASYGSRYRYTGDRDILPYGHGMRIESGRKPEVAYFWRKSLDAAISTSVCSYNHMSDALRSETGNSFKYLYDRKTGMCFKNLFNDAPCLNLMDEAALRAEMSKLVGREYLVFSLHEQYFYRDYFAYQPDYAVKIQAMCAFMTKAGYTFECIETVCAGV